MVRITRCKECWEMFAQSELNIFDLCPRCEDKLTVQAEPVVPVTYDEQEFIPTRKTGEELRNVATPEYIKNMHDEMGQAILANARRYTPKVPSMQERAAWFHHKQTTVAEQVGRGPKRPSFLTKLWLRLCVMAERVDQWLLRLI